MDECMNYEFGGINVWWKDQLQIFNYSLSHRASSRSGTLDDISGSFGVDRIIRRQAHGALVDSEILAQCYSRIVRL